MALMLQAMHTGPDRLLHLVGHTWPPEVLPQQRQGMVTSLMNCMSVVPIQGGNMMGLGDHKEQEIFGLTFGCSMQVQGSLMDCKIMPIP